MSRFVSNPKRNASPAIAGFVYQVNVTILRWLTLQPDELLELERGEDIDIIRREIRSGAAKLSRTLEQVKMRSAEVLTLANPAALSAIASFCEHRALNPRQMLRFRFITTSPVTKERDWTKGGSGIETWEALRKGELTLEETVNAMTSLRSFLSRRARPPKLSAKTWQRFRRVVSGPEDHFSSIVQSFEWSVAVGNLSTIEQQIKDLIVSWNSQFAPAEVESFYARLFLHVFKLLAQAKRKHLHYSDLTREHTIHLTPLDVRL